MKIKDVVADKLKNSERSNPEVEEHDTFEEDWKNGISGEEVVKRVHERIKVWWSENREKKS